VRQRSSSSHVPTLYLTLSNHTAWITSTSS
jgi:hypothetical protein